MDIRGIDAAAIRELARILDETNLTELEIEGEGTRVRVARDLPPTTTAVVAPPPMAAPVHAPQPAAVPAPVVEEAVIGKETVTSPMVGTVYLTAEPGAPPMIAVGSRVAEGDHCMIIGAMKMMNHISAPHSGVVTAIHVAHEEPVEFGAPLFSIE